MLLFLYSVNNWGFESKLQNFLNSITVNLKLRLTNLSNATIWHAPLETDHCKASTFRINLHKIIYSLFFSCCIRLLNLLFPDLKITKFIFVYLFFDKYR